LFVLCQHSPEDVLVPGSIFGEMQTALRSISADAIAQIFAPEAMPGQFMVKLYLRLLGQKQPYAADGFEYTAIAAAEAEESSEESPVDAEHAIQNHDRTDEVETDQTQAESEQEAVDRDNPFLLSPAFTASLDVPSLETLDRSQPSLAASDLAASDLESAAGEELETEPAHSSKSPLPGSAIAIGIGLIAFLFTGGWVLTRPCVIGACEPLQIAQAFNQKSAQTIQQAQSRQDLERVQQEMAEITRLLSSIPPWSGYHGQAQALLQPYAAERASLDQMVTAEQTAADARQKSQPSAKPIAELQTIQAQWQAAIAQLDTIPQSSPLYAFAQKRRPIYKAALTSTNQHLATEQNAEKNLATAKSTATMAEARQGIAKSAENWHLAQITWQVAVNALKQIPKDTTSFTEAQSLLTAYGAKLAESRDRATQEQNSSKNYLRATTLAQNAKALEQQNQWSQAVNTWRDALNAAKQVPKDTFFYDQAQSLIVSHTSALKSAEAQLQTATALQNVRSDLNRVCSGSPKICTYTMSSTVIRVQFTLAYERDLRTAYLVGKSGDYGTLGGTMHHLDTLQSAFQTICNNADIPVEVYGADGSNLLGSFSPNR
jgi:hypothetical protein